MTVISEPSLMDVPNFSDGRGQLGVVEGDGLPFEIRRFYYLFDAPVGAVRGEHGHKILQQFIICMTGTCDIMLHDGTRRFDFTLDSPSSGLHVPPGMWRSLKFPVPRTVICVLASRPYEEEDYLYGFDEFVEWKQSLIA